jgi:hypothetical protein
MKYLPCEFRQQLGAPVARASSVKTSNIGTLDALTGSVKQPFMQSAAKSDSEPRIQNAARRTNDRFRKVGRELSSFASGKGTLRQSFVHTLPLRDRHPEVLGQPSSVYGKPSNA